MKAYKMRHLVTVIINTNISQILYQKISMFSPFLNPFKFLEISTNPSP